MQALKVFICAALSAFLTGCVAPGRNAVNILNADFSLYPRERGALSSNLIGSPVGDTVTLNGFGRYDIESFTGQNRLYFIALEPINSTDVYFSPSLTFRSAPELSIGNSVTYLVSGVIGGPEAGEAAIVVGHDHYCEVAKFRLVRNESRNEYDIILVNIRNQEVYLATTSNGRYALTVDVNRLTRTATITAPGPVSRIVPFEPEALREFCRSWQIAYVVVGQTSGQPAMTIELVSVVSKNIEPSVFLRGE